MLPRLAGELPPGQARVVFHAATRLPRTTGPAGRLRRRDQVPERNQAAVVAVGRRRPQPNPRPQPARHGPALSLRDPDGAEHLLAVVDGHLAWIEPLRGPFRRT